MNVLVIGGTSGFIGTAAVRKLAAAGHNVAVFHRGTTNAELPPSVQHILGDREQLAGHTVEFERFAPEAVLDMYLRFEPEARAVMDVFRGIAQRIVAISSQDVYRNYGLLWGIEDTVPNEIPITEDASLRTVLYPYRKIAKDPGDPKYNYDKIPVERIVMSDPELSGTVLRLPATYGPGDSQHRLFEYLKRMDDNRPFILLDESEAEWRWTHGYVEDVAEAILLAVIDKRASRRIYNVGEPTASTRKEWVESIGKLAGWKGRVIGILKEQLPEHLKSPTGYEHDLVVDTGRIRNELGFTEKFSREEALLKTIAWERENPPPAIDAKQFDYDAEDAALEKLTL